LSVTPRLLVIDDSPTIRKLVELSFNNTEWLVEFAATGRDGVDRARARPPSVILLDFILPDMRGSDVCERLNADPRSAETPIIVMSAKQDDVRELFAGFASVADFVGKPFTAGDIVARVNRLFLRTRAPERASIEPAPAAGASRLSYAQKEAAAQAIYTRLRPQLALIPELMKDLGNAPPATFFARKLLTPRLIEGLFDALLPLLGDAVNQPASDDGGTASLFEGRLGSVPLFELLTFLSATRKSGELRVEFSGYVLSAYFKSGEVVFVTCNDPERYARGASLDAIRPELWARAESAQRSTGKPVFVTLAEVSAFETSELAPLLERQGRRLLIEALGSVQGTFAWREGATAPLWVEAFPRPLSLPGLALDRLRQSTVWSDVERSLSGPDALFERAEGFSRKVQKFALSENERRVLALVDGDCRLAEIAERADLPEREIWEIVYRLAEVGLLARRDSREPGDAAPLVLIADPDVDRFVEPLRVLLHEFDRRLRVVALPPEQPVVEAVRRDPPKLLIVNASALGNDAARAAETVRAMPELGELRLVAVLEAPAAEQAGRLTTAGYDAVFTKPIAFSDLEPLLEA